MNNPFEIAALWEEMTKALEDGNQDAVHVTAITLQLLMQMQMIDDANRRHGETIAAISAETAVLERIAKVLEEGQAHARSLERKVKAPADPYMPDWSTAPEWAQWHAYDKDGQGNYFEQCPICDGDGEWMFVRVMHRYDVSQCIAMDGLNHYNSLRRRPE